MACTRFEHLRLQHPHDATWQEQPAWRVHLANCPDCVEAVALDRLLQQAVAELPAPPVSTQAERILSAWQHEQAPMARPTETLATSDGTRGSRRLRTWLPAALATALLIAISYWQQTQPQLGTPQVAALQDSTTPQLVQTESASSTTDVIRTVQQVYEHLVTDKLSQWNSDAVSVTTVANSGNDFPSETALAAESLTWMSPPQLLEPLNELKSEFEPIGTEVRRAVGFLWSSPSDDESL